MKDIRLGVIESHFAEIIWKNEPLPSGELVKLCEKELCWKKSTTYTVLRKLCERGIFQNQNGIVSSVVSRDEFDTLQCEQFINEAFHGSLPAFLTAFTKRNKLSDKEIRELEHLIQNNRR